MKRRSESELLINRDPSFPNKGQKDRLIIKEQRLLQENKDLRRKVDESRPILETIYDKVRKKQQMYQGIIADNEEKHERIAEMAREYHEFGHQAIRIINDHGLMKQEEPQEEKERKLVRNYQSAGNLNTGCNFRNIIEEYRRSKAEITQERVTSQSIYERYLSKLGEKKENKERENTLSKVRKLSKEIDSDLEDLKLKKNRSQIRLTQGKALKLAPFEEKPKLRKDKKAYFLQLQKRKLKLL